ncbi:hypothetical protein ACVWWJ_001795 [Luteibacter sp. HA06]
MSDETPASPTVPDLSGFRRLVEQTDPIAVVGEEERDRQISDCFPRDLGHEIVVGLRDIEANLAVRLICDDVAMEPHGETAKRLRIALHKHRGAAGAKLDWSRAVGLASGTGIGAEIADQMARRDERWVPLAAGVSLLRKHGYTVRLPAEGGIVLPEAEKQRLWGEIRLFAKRYAGRLTRSMAAGMANHYSSFSGRFRVGRGGMTVDPAPKPNLPFSYIYHLALSHTGQRPGPPPSEAEFMRTMDLVKGFMALEDLTLPLLDIHFGWLNDLPAQSRKSAMFDAAFIPAQAKASHAKTYLDIFFADPVLGALKDAKTGRTGAQVGRVALALLDLADRRPPGAMVSIDHALAASLTGMPGIRGLAFLRAVFAHDHAPNQKLGLPPRDSDIDAAFRPFVDEGTGLLMQPAPLAARATVNAAIQWLRERRPERFDDDVIGAKLELLVRSRLAASSIDVLHGHYKAGKDEGECDALIETEKALIFLELKSKMLQREGRAGDDVTLLADLGQAVVRPLAQAMGHHAFLVKHGKMVIAGGDSEHVVELKGRDVYKVALSRGELASLGDMAFLRRFLLAGCVAEFTPRSEAQKGKLKDLGKYFKRFRKAAEGAGDFHPQRATVFSTCSTLSAFQFLMLLENVNDADGFAEALARTGRMMTPERDFYTTYEFLTTKLHR